MVTENCIKGGGGYYCASPSMISFIAIYRKRGTYWPYTCLFKETDACPQCRGLACFLSDGTTNCLLLHNPLPLRRPIACFYWLISLLFNISASPHWPLSFPQSSFAVFFLRHNSVLSFPMRRGHFETETTKSGSFLWSSIKMDISSLKRGLCRISQGVLQTSENVTKNMIAT